MLSKLSETLRRYTVTTWVCCAYLFFSHVPRTTALVNLIMGIMLLLTCVLVAKRALVIEWKSPLVRAFAGFLMVVLLGIAFSPYWQESLIPLRREFLPMVLCFILLTSQKAVRQDQQQTEVASLAAWSIIAAFVCRSFLALSDWLRQGVSNDVYSVDRTAARFFDFFAIDATLMMPLVVAGVLYLSMRRGIRSLLCVSLAVAWLLIFVSGVRAALIALGIVTVLQLLPLLWRYKLITLVSIMAIAMGVVLSAPDRLHKMSERYATIVSADTYEAKEGGYSSFYERLSIWNGTLQMVAQRPLLGYGLGWQKLYDVAYQDGYIERWKNSDKLIERAAENYFRPLVKGGANPHNLWIDILFETGIAGLFFYSAILIILLVRAVRMQRQHEPDALTRWFSRGTLAFFLSYILVNLMNGLWLTSGATLMLLIVSELLMQKNKQGAARA